MTATLTPLPLSIFDEALCFVMAREGGYSDTPGDSGAATNMGVTQATYDAFCKTMGIATRSVMFITPRQVRTIYWDGYWRAAACDSIAGVKPQLALVTFDCAVNQGAGESTLCLQRALGVTADGAFGPSTMAAVAACIEPATIMKLLVERARVYRKIVAAHPGDAQFLAGWLARLRWCARATGVAIDPSFAPPSS